MEFPVLYHLVAREFYIRWQHLIFVFMYIVQLYKEDLGNLAYVGLSGHSSLQYQANSLYIAFMLFFNIQWKQSRVTTVMAEHPLIPDHKTCAKQTWHIMR